MGALAGREGLWGSRLEVFGGPGGAPGFAVWSVYAVLASRAVMRMML